MIFSPLSEIPSVGRNIVYIVTLFIALIFMVAAAVAPNFGALLVFRFLAAFFGSPAMATGGATIQDVYTTRKVPYGFAAWVAAATMGPALGPLLGGFAAQAKDWRWPLWIQVWLTAPVLLLMFFTLPETSEVYLLKRRAERLRRLTGSDNLRSVGELEQAGMTLYGTVQAALIRPIQISLLDSGCAFINIYLAYTYAIYYSFFESFPLIYPVYYGFDLGQTGLTFVSIIITTIIGASVYSAYQHYYVEPKIDKQGYPPLEERLIPAIPGSILMPIGLFMFAWTARASIHWSVALIGVGIYGLGLYLLIQCALLYIPLVYPKYGASLLAGNDFCRSSLAAGFVLFGRPLFINLGIGGGVSLLAGLTCLCIPGIVLLYIFGASLRAKSKFAGAAGSTSNSAEKKVAGDESV
jgi:DHA1 family multidrug resistance protein-like MFS transporter